jgi:hypothetical protein
LKANVFRVDLISELARELEEVWYFCFWLIPPEMAVWSVWMQTVAPTT